MRYSIELSPFEGLSGKMVPGLFSSVTWRGGVTMGATAVGVETAPACGPAVASMSAWAAHEGPHTVIKV